MRPASDHSWRNHCVSSTVYTFSSLPLVEWKNPPDHSVVIYYPLGGSTELWCFISMYSPGGATYSLLAYTCCSYKIIVIPQWCAANHVCLILQCDLKNTVQIFTMLLAQCCLFLISECSTFNEGSGGHAVERRTVNQGDGGSIPPTTVLKLKQFHHPTFACVFRKRH